MDLSPNVNAWLEGAAPELASRVSELCSTVEALRATETIYPPQGSVFRALELTAPADVRVVILGQDPYHEEGQAMGLSFSVPEGQKLPPSLRNIYKELASDLGCESPATGDLSAWASQGVLLLNTTLTVRAHAANSHVKLGWQELTGHVVERCLELPQPVVFLTWGKHAINMVEGARQKAAQAANETEREAPNKFFLASTHPSPLSARRGTAELPAFMGSRPFSKTNELLASCGAEPIRWA